MASDSDGAPHIKKLSNTSITTDTGYDTIDSSCMSFFIVIGE